MRSYLGPTANVTEQGRLRREERFWDEQKTALVQWLFSTPQGRQFAYFLEDEILALGTEAWGGNTEITLCNVGVHDRGIQWRELAQTSAPDGYVLMLQEQRDAWRDRARRAREAATAAEGETA